MRKVPQVGVAAVDGFLGGGHGDVMGGSVGDGIFARTDFPFTPGGNDLQPRIEGHDGQFEAHLVVAFAGRPVGDGICSFGMSDIHQPFGDQRTGSRCAQQVFPLVDCSGFHHGHQIVTGQFFSEVFDDQFAGPRFEGFLFETAQILALAHVGAVADDLTAIIFFQPRHNHRGIQTARIGQNHFLDSLLFTC